MEFRPISNPEAEEGAIVAILKNPQSIHDLQQVLTPEMFTGDKETPRKEIYEAASKVIQSGKHPDYASVKIEINRIRQTDRVEEIYMEGLFAQEYQGENNGFYHAQLVAEMYMRREGIAKIQQLSEDLTDFRKDVFESLEELDFQMMQMRAFLQRKRIREIGDYANEMFVEFEKLRSGEMEYFKTGIPCVDQATGGYEPATLNIIGARPSMGKTMFMGQMILNNASKGIPVGMLSMEMAGKHLVRRFAGNLAAIDTKKIRSPRENPMEQKEFQRFKTVLNEIVKMPIHIDETRFPKLGDVLFKMREMAQKGCKAIIFDHLGLIQFDGNSRLNRNLQLGVICKMISAQLLMLDVTGIMLSQLSRKCEERPNKRPVMSDLRDSGEVEQDAQTVSFLYRDEYYNPNDPQCIDGTPGFNRMEILYSKKREGCNAQYSVLGCNLQHQKVFDLEHPPYKEPIDDLPEMPGLNNFLHDN